MPLRVRRPGRTIPTPRPRAKRRYFKQRTREDYQLDYQCYTIFMNKNSKGFASIIVLIAAGIIASSVVGVKMYGFSKDLSALKNQAQKVPVAGAVNPVGGKNYALYGGGIGSSDTSITLSSFKTPVSDYNFAMASFGTIGYLTLEPGSATRQEFISFTGIRKNANGPAPL